jgi:hypothetical protein
LGCYEFIEDDMRRVLEATRTTGKILESYNTSFIAMIPKEDNPTSFEKSRVISLCNCFYKLSQNLLPKDLKWYYQNKYLESSLDS